MSMTVEEYDKVLKRIAYLACDEDDGNSDGNIELICRVLAKCGYLRIVDDYYMLPEEERI